MPCDSGPIRAFNRQACLWIRGLHREAYAGGLDQWAMALVYLSLLSMVPLLAVSFSVLKAFGVHNQMEPMLLRLLAPLGEKATEISANILSFVEHIQVGVLGFVGLATLFYTVIALLAKIEAAFNRVWRVSSPRSWPRRFNDYLSVVLVGPVLLVSAMGLTASTASNALVQRIIQLQPFGMIYYGASVVLPYLLIVVAFSFAYAFMPNTRVRLRSALAGGVAAGLAWQAGGSLFAAFVAGSAQYSAIYSGFAVVLVFMIWLYLSWYILLAGAAVAFLHQNPRYLHYAVRHPRLSIRDTEALGLQLMYLIGRSHMQGLPALHLDHLASAVGTTGETARETLGHLQQSGLLLSLKQEPDAYLLARDTDAVELGEILRAIRTAGDDPDDAGGVTCTEIMKALSDCEAGYMDATRRRTLRDLISGTAATGNGTEH
jgi:membrane protein